jgi:zinc transport system substrate-binding protein
MIRTILAIVLFGWSAWAFPAGMALSAVPEVVVSIKPVHSLAAGVMKGVGEPTLLIKGGASPHSYSLRPSEAASLQNADVVFWIGDELETFLDKPLQALPKHATVVALHEADGVTLLPFREGTEWEQHLAGPMADPEDHGHAEHSHHGDTDHHDEEHTGTHNAEHTGEHAHGEKNMHIWLDPTNAQAMVHRIVAVLSERDSANAPRYRANGAALIDRLIEVDTAIDRDLAPIKSCPYIVFHDAYQYFETHYGLSPAGSISVDPDRKPGARRITEIRRKIGETGAVCVFSEPQFEPAIVKTVIAGTNAKTAVLDPLGAELAPGADAYFELMRGLATSLRGCLRQSS